LQRGSDVSAQPFFDDAVIKEEVRTALMTEADAVVSQRVSQRKRVQTPKAAEAGQGDKQAKYTCKNCGQPKASARAKCHCTY